MISDSPIRMFFGMRIMYGMIRCSLWVWTNQNLWRRLLDEI